jgi:hypothetical protein
VGARVYIHLRADSDGQNALNALRVLCDSLESSGGAIDERTRSQIVLFKIGELKVLHQSRDNAVIYTKSLEGAKKVAEALSNPLRPYTAPGLPAMVKPVPNSQGIGVAVEPERPLDNFTKHYELAEQYSYGTHRSEIIARGLLVVALQNNDTVPYDVTPCYNAVAMKFQHYGMHPFKPYKASPATLVGGI